MVMVGGPDDRTINRLICFFLLVHTQNQLEVPLFGKIVKFRIRFGFDSLKYIVEPKPPPK